MFIYSVRASTLRFAAVALLALAVLIGVFAFGGGESVYASAELDLTGLKTNDERVAFIEKLGLSVEEAPVETVEFRIPESFDRIISGYNELQRRQGLDLTKYKNKRAERFTYLVREYDGYDGDVYVNLIIYKGRLIGADVSSADPKGFLEPLIKLGE